LAARLNNWEGCIRMNEQHEANRRRWDALAEYWRELRDGDGRWQRIMREPGLAFEGGALELIEACTGGVRGKRACVIGSGDNYAAFALAGMGARVTSVDISRGQLAVAAERAALLGLEITFVRADAAQLEPLQSGAFDLVCSTNGFFVWISDPGQVFRAVERVLKPGGFYIFYDIHPFQRPWKNQAAPIEMVKPYDSTGPFVEMEEGGASYEFNWRLSACCCASWSNQQRAGRTSGQAIPTAQSVRTT
jgi:SAM-dependent methyltransferase